MSLGALGRGERWTVNDEDAEVMRLGIKSIDI